MAIGNKVQVTAKHAVLAVLGVCALGGALAVLFVVQFAQLEKDREAAQASAALEESKRVEEEKKKFEAIPQEEKLRRVRVMISSKDLSGAKSFLGRMDPKSSGVAAAKKELARAENEKARQDAGVRGMALRAIRISFAKELEKTYLDKGINADVVATGNEKTVLDIKWALASKVAAHHFSKGDILENAQKIGFKKVVLRDGYSEGYSWTF